VHADAAVFRYCAGVQGADEAGVGRVARGEVDVLR
jgi:hypothetical protein